MGRVSTAGIHFVLAEEGKGGCGCRLGWEEMIFSNVDGGVFPRIELMVVGTYLV